jgi:hypothetical protein
MCVVSGFVVSTVCKVGGRNPDWTWGRKSERTGNSNWKENQKFGPRNPDLKVVAALREKAESRECPILINLCQITVE